MLQGLTSPDFRSFISWMRLDLLASTSDWAFVMAEADALQSEDPAGCLSSALKKAASADHRRYALVAAELMRRGAAEGLAADWPGAERPTKRLL